MQESRPLLSLLYALARDFRSAEPSLIYRRCVQASLDEPGTKRLLGARKHVTPQAVHDQMSALGPNPWLYFVPSERHAVFQESLTERELRRRQHEQAELDCDWNWQAVCAGIGFVLIMIASLGGFLVFLATVAIAAVTLTIVWSRGWGVGLWLCLLAVWTGTRSVVSRIQLGIAASIWGKEVQRRIEPEVRSTTRWLLGEDPDSLLLPETSHGLRAPRSPSYIVPIDATALLDRKLSQLESGTIAICGPRGAGKSTLLERSVDRARFGLLAQAPATYAPHDFLLSLSVDLCERYIQASGYTVPSFSRLSPTRQLLRRWRKGAIRTLKWLAFAVPAAALLFLSLRTSVWSAVTERAPDLTDRLERYTDRASPHLERVWEGAPAGVSVLLAIIAVAWWQARRVAWLPRRLGEACSRALYFFGIGLNIWAINSLLNDDWTQRHLPQIPLTVAAWLVSLAVLWATLRRLRYNSIGYIEIGGWSPNKENVYRLLSSIVLAVMVLTVVWTPELLVLLAAPENPLRIAVVLVAFAMIGASHWTPKAKEPPLVGACRDHLYRLQTIQMSTSAVTTGSSQMLSLGGSTTTSLSTVPPNYPELVADFRSLLTRIARHISQDHTELLPGGAHVVIAIDEVDRLGSDTQARAFLSEIKAILGVPHVHYLIAVAEDVGAAFVRRGLPHRDVTDSSLDDIVYLQPARLDESFAVLERRAPGLSEPYTMLAHALSGGILRDLIRYGRRIIDMHDKANSRELTDISRHLVMEELSETLAGFRTLLSKQQWSPHTGDTLTALHELGRQIRSLCPCTENNLYTTLEELAHHTTDNQPTNNTDDHSRDAQQLIDEASAYAYFSLTLLNIFSTPGLERRKHAAAENGIHGSPELLAEARQELAISPHSARALISKIRTSWALPTHPHRRTGTPLPRRSTCHIHD